MKKIISLYNPLWLSTQANNKIKAAYKKNNELHLDLILVLNSKYLIRRFL